MNIQVALEDTCWELAELVHVCGHCEGRPVTPRCTIDSSDMNTARRVLSFIADAWAEGYIDGMNDAIDDRSPDATPNPYRMRDHS